MQSRGKNVVLIRFELSESFDTRISHKIAHDYKIQNNLAINNKHFSIKECRNKAGKELRICNSGIKLLAIAVTTG